MAEVRREMTMMMERKMAAVTLNARATPKVMPPIFLCWPMTLEADEGGVAVDVELSYQRSIKFCCRVTDGSRGAI